LKKDLHIYKNKITTKHQLFTGAKKIMQYLNPIVDTLHPVVDGMIPHLQHIGSHSVLGACFGGGAILLLNICELSECVARLAISFFNQITGSPETLPPYHLKRKFTVIARDFIGSSVACATFMALIATLMTIATNVL